MMGFVIMAICIAVEVVIFFLTDDDDVATVAGMAAAAGMAATIVWGLIYFEII